MTKNRPSPDSSSQNPEEPQKSSGIKIYGRLLHYVRRYWVIFLFGIIGTIFASGIDAGLTWSLKPLLDQGFIARNQQFINILPFAVIIAFLLRGSANFTSTYFLTRVARTVVMVFRQEIFDHLLHLPSRYYDSSTSGQLLSTLIYNVEQVAEASSRSLLIIVRESFFLLGLLIVMLTISWKLTLLFFITAPVIGFIANYSSKRMRKFSHHLQHGMGEITRIAEEAIEGYRVIRTFGGTTYERNKFLKANNYNFNREMKLIITEALASPSVQIVVSVVIAITVYVATNAVGNITAGGFASILAAMLAMLKPLKNITTVNNRIQKGIAAVESIFQLLDEPPEQDTGTERLTQVKGAVRYSNVTFSYENSSKKVLQNLNFSVESGQTVALVGKSGAGKSTLVSLLPRFYDGFTGTITIDGIDTKSIKLADLRNQFALVSQHTTLFNDTIAHNIAYGQFETLSDEDIIKAAEAAHAMEFINNMPDGIHTLIGENGVLLSGGQRQRIAIARALLKDAPILILDEATSALDTESERHIQSAMQELMKNRTTLVIAHRLSTIENADKIILLQDGQILEAGTHSQLLAYQGYYAKLHAMQFNDNHDQPALETQETSTVAV